MTKPLPVSLDNEEIALQYWYSPEKECRLLGLKYFSDNDMMSFIISALKEKNIEIRTEAVRIILNKGTAQDKRKLLQLKHDIDRTIRELVIAGTSMLEGAK